MEIINLNCVFFYWFDKLSHKILHHNVCSVEIVLYFVCSFFTFRFVWHLALALDGNVNIIERYPLDVPRSEYVVLYREMVGT
jgi:hypothetical protein